MAVVASAPGKVLMTGGYLVLERPNAGIVLSTNARFYAILKPLYDQLESDNEWMDLKVNSPQMSRETAYKMSVKDFTLDCSSESRNPFVEYAVQYSIAAAYATLDKNRRNEFQKLLLQGMEITILGCNDFYSYRNQIEARGLPLTPESLASLPPFTSITFNAGESNVKNCKPEVAKTGLGSSAAMTTAVVAALLNYLGVVDLSHCSLDQKSEHLDFVHMIAQTAHCIAQGKVGSGFDVSSAVYGSHRYVRFSPNVISSAQETVSTTRLDEVIGKVLKGKWDHERTKFSLPPLMNLILGEPGSGGSSTPSMVGAVKEWQKSDPQKSQETWNKLSEANSALEAQFNLLSKLAADHWDSYKAVIDSCGRFKFEKWIEKFNEASHVEIVKALLGARDIMLRIRCHMRQMGEAAGIPFTIDNTDDSKTPNFTYTSQLEGLIDVLLTVVNRPNHGIDRQLRGAACECLRELERECPSLLSETAGHLWGLCQSEKTHVAQSYVLMLANVVHGMVISKVNVSMLSTSIPLTPFNVPLYLTGGGSRENSGLAVKELRRVISFLLEWPQYLTPFGLFEFMSIIMPVAVALELQASFLKVQFSGLLYTFDMLLCHAFLGMYLQFPEAFSGQENEVVSRILLISRETQHVLVFRLLALHWLLGFLGLVMSKRKVIKEKIFATALRFYPTVFDPLALKALKLDLIAYCSILLDMSRLADVNGQTVSDVDNSEVPVVKLFEDGLESVSGFKWLPPWSTETSVAFRTFHKLLIGASSHSDTGSPTRDLKESKIFHASEKMLVTMTLESQGLIPVIVAFVNRLLGCSKHHCFGVRLLQTFDNHLLPKVNVDRLGSYFPLFGKIAENDTVPPGGLLDLLGRYMSILVEKHGPETGLRSWSQGSKVLVLCRTILMHHQSSRVFLGLSRLLAFTCLHFPDLEVRDNARIYLRMLLCVPGKKLRHLLSTGDQLPGISPSSHSTSFFSVQSPRFSYDSKKLKEISSYIHLERVVPLLVKQSWSLSLTSFGIGGDKPCYLEVIKDSDTPSAEPETADGNTDFPIIPALEGPNEPLRVTDSKVSQIVEILRRHFSLIPDFRHMSGIKIGISCNLSFQSLPFNQVWGDNSVPNGSPGVDALPALYATVLKFSSSAPYGSIQPYRIPFLLGEPAKNDIPSSQTDSLDIVPVGNGPEEVEEEHENFKAPVLIELQPREPSPGLIDVSIEANAENGQIICGHLQSITVGIEDMFLKALVPDDISDDAVPGYFVDLFNALWEACGSSSSTGRETFPLKGGKGVAAINGTQSVKFLDVPATSLVRAVERNLAPFLVNVIGDPLINIVKDGGIIKDIVWNDDTSGSSLDVVPLDPDMIEGPLYLKYDEEEDDRGNNLQLNKGYMGCFHILIFLPPTSHLLFQMEVGVGSTLVRIRTDHWPCLAYIDDYLEALFLA